MTKYGSYLFITEWSDYFYLFLEDSLRVCVYMDMSNCSFVTCGHLPANYSQFITYWIIITLVVIELLYVKKFCYNKEPGLLLWEYNTYNQLIWYNNEVLIDNMLVLIEEWYTIGIE